jgi:hypothetical protein
MEGSKFTQLINNAPAIIFYHQRDVDTKEDGFDACMDNFIGDLLFKNKDENTGYT